MFWDKYPHLRPALKRFVSNISKNGALYGHASADNYSCVCLVTGRAAEKRKWIVDSGAKAHMCHHKSKCSTYQDVKQFNVTIEDNSFLEAVGKGTIEFTVWVINLAAPCKFMNV